MSLLGLATILFENKAHIPKLVQVFFFFSSFLFSVGVYLVNNIVLVSGVQPTDSVTHTYTCVCCFSNSFPNYVVT